MARTLVAVAAGVVLVSQASAAAARAPTLEPLVAEADRVWQLSEMGDVVGAGNRCEVLVRAADALRASGKLEMARDYYRRAALVRPWDLDTKVRFAEALLQIGDADAARSMAGQVQTFAETDRLLDASRALAGVVPLPELPTVASLAPQAGEVVLGLVCAPNTDHWMPGEVGRRLSGLLGVRVGLVAAPFVLGKPDRTGRAQLAEELRRSLPWTEQRMTLYVPGGKLVPPQFLSDDAVISVMRKLVEHDGGPEQIQSFRAQLALADAQQNWDVSRLLSDLGQSNVQPSQGKVVYLALVPVDLFSGSTDFLFGSASPTGNYGVVSFCRFAASFTGEPPKRARLVDRLCKQMLSTAGFALGVPRCGDLRCARSYPRSLAEHDAKGAGLCPECRAGFAKVLGHALPAGE
jgi:predicted Zn-dependent protease